jgi:sensor histidine kinase regulating citrate/malate metabolism
MNSQSSCPITYEHVFFSTSNGVIATDNKSNTALINQKAIDTLGIDNRKKNNTTKQLIPPLARLIQVCLKSGKSQMGQHVEWNGNQFVANVTPIKNHGNLLGAVINFQRTHQFEASAKKLHSFVQLNKQLETIFSSSSDGLWVCDGEGRIININKASEQLNDIRAEDYVGKKMTDIVSNGFMDRSVSVEVLKKKRTDERSLYTGHQSHR